MKRTVLVAMSTILLVTIIASLNVPKISAVTTTWTGNGGDGRWENPHNWDSGSIPGSSSNVLISNGATVTINSTQTINALSINGTGTQLNCASCSLTINGGSSVGSITSTGTIANSASFTNLGTFTNYGGALLRNSGT